MATKLEGGGGKALVIHNNHENGNLKFNPSTPHFIPYGKK